MIADQIRGLRDHRVNHGYSQICDHVALMGRVGTFGHVGGGRTGGHNKRLRAHGAQRLYRPLI